MGRTGMRIAIVGSRHLLSGYSGVERGLSQFLPALARRGHTVTVFAGGAGLRDTGTGPAGASFDGVGMVEVPCIVGKHTETITRSALSLAMAVRGRYDVVHFQHQGPGILSALTRPLMMPSVVTVCGLDWRRAKWSRPAKFAIRAAERAAVRCASGIAVVSRTLQRYFAQEYGFDTTLIPNALPRKAVPRSRDALDRHGLAPEGYVLFAARLVPEKGCHDLIAAWNGIETGRKLVIAGAGRYDDAYVGGLRGAADPDKVVFTGHLEREAMDQLIANAHLFVLPSYLEGMSNALLEALAFGRAALVSDIPENLEVIEDNGFSFRCGDSGDLRATLAVLLADEGRVRTMKARASNMAADAITWEEVAERHEALYASVVRPSPRLATR